MSWDHRYLLCQALDSPEPSAAALERHELRVARALLAPRPRSRRRWAVATLVLAGGLVAGLVLDSGPRTFVLERADGESVMAGVTAWTDGRVEGTVEGRALALTLDQGRLELDVDPARDLDVQVSTDDAQVSVRGTHFSVTRGPSGTLVEVERGRVAVTCSGREQQQLLGAGGRVTCLRSVGL